MFEALRKHLAGQLYTEDLYTWMHATDGSIFSRRPAAVVYPKNTADVVAVVGFAKAHGLAVHPRGAGSGLCGAAIGAGIVIDFSKHMNQLLGLDPVEKSFTCQPGFRLGELETALKGKGLFFPPDPSSGEYATFGGMCATNASGAHSVKYGNAADYLLDAELVIGSGEVVTLSQVRNTPLIDLPAAFAALAGIYEVHASEIEEAYPQVRCNTAGYNLRGLVSEGRLDLRRLIAGAEGTLGVVTWLKFKLLDKPTTDSLVVAFFDSIEDSARAVQHLLPMAPSGIEIMDKSLLELARDEEPQLRDKIPAGVDNVLLIEFDGTDAGVCQALAQRAKQLLAQFTQVAHVAVSEDEKARFWGVRKAAVPILYRLKGQKKILALIEDAAVPTDQLVSYFRGIYEILGRFGVTFVTYGHIAKGLMHTRPLLNLKDPGDVALLRPIADAIFDLVCSLGGSVSGEHGDGRLRSAYIHRRYPTLWPLFLKLKQHLDPHHIFNPEILTVEDPDQMAQHLRYGTHYHGHDLPSPELIWPDGSAVEIERCHGCSKCTTVTTATRMCPVYKFTRDEAAAPKAKANLLRALISGAIKDSVLFSETFQNVMKLCVGCGSCAVECPSQVNIPKLAAEARARYVRRFGASRHDRIVVEAELAGKWTRKVSGILSPLLHTTGMRVLTEIVTGVSRHRDPVVFASRSLSERIQVRTGRGTPRVLYFAGCEAAYLEPDIGQAAVSVLSAMGMTVIAPPPHCCGLPQFSKGMTDAAKKKIAVNVKRWGAMIDTIDYIAVTCSSCGHALAETWADLAPGHTVQNIGAKVIHISRLVNRFADRLRLQPARVSVAYHAPCHLRIQPEPECSVRMLERISKLDVIPISGHCCGMAGSWGMAAANYELSRRIGTAMIQGLNESSGDVGATDCPTCRIQMRAFSKKRIYHPIQIVAAAMPSFYARPPLQRSLALSTSK